MKTRLLSSLLTILWSAGPIPELSAQSTAFTYQGRLEDRGSPAGGIYDLRFTIYDAAGGGSATGGPITNAATAVSNGLFTVTLDFGAGVFSGAARWLEIGVRTNGSVLAHTVLVPRQPLTSTPYAVRALNAGAAATAESVTGPVPAGLLTGTIAPASLASNSVTTDKIADGTIQLSDLSGGVSNAFWQLGGNTGSSPGTHFLGTKDNQPLEFKVNGIRALRLEPTPPYDPGQGDETYFLESVNVIGGFWGNVVGPNVSGATIGGGGILEVYDEGDGPNTNFFVNRVSADFGTVGGGSANTIEALARHSTIAGGFSNTIQTNNEHATIGGGRGNLIDASGSGTIAGGSDNEIHAQYATVGGGHGNTIQPNARNSTIAGGYVNTIRAVPQAPEAGTIGGGQFNSIVGPAHNATIAGGYLNTISSNAESATVGGGQLNTSSTAYSTVGGGFQNVASGNFDGVGDSATVAGGYQNSAVGSASFVGGGYANYARGNGSTIAGGWLHTNQTGFGVIGGGRQNLIDLFSRFSVVSGGGNNTVESNATYSVIAGGQLNRVGTNAPFATIPGGFENLVTAANGFAAGTRAKARHTGAFVWADAQDGNFPSTTTNQFNVRASGGVRLETGGAGVTVDGEPVVSGQVGAAQIADGAITAAKLAMGSVDASRLADGAAAANLRADGQLGVAGGGIILSEQSNATNLLAAGYVKLGSASLDDDTWQPKNLSSPSPLARQAHTAVWTGSEMIIWGGRNGTSYLGTGGRYNPTTDSWTQTRTAPIGGRDGHTAVWTGTEMIVWGGGAGGSTLFPDGARYRPSLDNWQPISASNAPSARKSHSAVWTGNAMLVWSGTTTVGQTNNTGGMYDPVTDSWTAIPTNGAPTGRTSHSAVWTGSEMIIWGGQVGLSNLNTGARFDPASQVWTATPTNNAPPARAGHAAVWTGNEMIVWGSTTGGTTNSGGRYNPVTDLWTPTSMTNTPGAGSNIRVEHVWTGTEMIVLTSSVSLQAGARYNPLTDQWTPLSTNQCPMGRSDYSAVWTDTEMIVWGGDLGIQGVQSTGSRYRLANNSWSAIYTGDPGPSDRENHTAVWTGTEMIVWGGDTATTQISGGRYNPVTDTWRSLPRAPGQTGRGHSAVWTGTEMIVWGGEGSAQRGKRYFPSTDTWLETSPTPELVGPHDHWGRRYHSAVWTGSEMIVWGGVLGSTELDAGYRYLPARDSWSSVHSSGDAPSRRYGHTAVWTGTEMIIWGGTDGSSDRSYLHTGARYTPANNLWTALSTNDAPAGRGFHTAIWTGSEMLIWGGQNNDNPNKNDLYADGGRYNASGNYWTPITTNGAPTARVGHTAVWTGSEMIIWGGPNTGTDREPGGRFDPASGTWTPTELVGSPGTTGNHTAVWTGSGMLVFGGASGQNYRFNLYSLKRPMYLYLKP
jgi:N-acetylneuraminic acid mutarotase